MKVKWDILSTTVLVACALLTTGLVVRSEFNRHNASPAERKPVLIKDWRSELQFGVTIGRPAAPVQLIEFGDFECPFCAEFDKDLKKLQERYPAQVAVTFVHFPLKGHRFALLAARAAECAGDQGRFDRMHDQLFENQDQFGLKSWNDYAAKAGVSDLALFDACISASGRVPRIDQGLALGGKLDVQGTPTLIINGWKLGQPPTAAELDQMIKLVLDGKSPVAG